MDKSNDWRRAQELQEHKRKRLSAETASKLAGKAGRLNLLGEEDLDGRDRL